MLEPEFVAADPVTDGAALQAINTEYMTWVFEEMAREFGVPAHSIAGMPTAQYVAKSLHKLCAAHPPQGVFYLIRLRGELVGMCGVRQLDADTAELKRIYIRPALRGQQLGGLALQRLLADARSFGYRRVCLDSAPFMQAAQQLYAAHGFVDCAPYPGTEVSSRYHARWRFMQLSL